MSNYATKSDLKEMRGISTSKLAKKVQLASKVDQVDIDILETLLTA